MGRSANVRPFHKPSFPHKHCTRLSSRGCWWATGCMKSPVCQEKARERLLRALVERLCFSWRLGRQVLTAPPASSRPMGKAGLIC